MKAELTSIDSNGDQTYHTDGRDSRTGIRYDHLKTIILSGIDRAQKVNVGDKGTLNYHSTATRGWYSFTKLPPTKLP
jgi:hypothetical protein